MVLYVHLDGSIAEYFSYIVTKLCNSSKIDFLFVLISNFKQRTEYNVITYNLSEIQHLLL